MNDNDLETQDGLEMFWQDKPKELPSVLSGFTPAPDVLIKKYGFVTALIWGRVWRYCQGPYGSCQASLETIAKELNMSVRNVLRDIKQLCTDGYLADETPNLRNKPHTYADTGKIRIRVSVEAGESGMTQSHGRVTESQRHHDSESLEERSKKQLKKKKVSLSQKEIQKKGEQVKGYLDLLSQGTGKAWTGRETFLPQHLPLVDWYHGATGQDCPKGKRAEWMKAVGAWAAAGLTVADLQAAYDMDINWRKVFTGPNQLTDKAMALKAQKKATPRPPTNTADQAWRQEVTF